MGLTFRLGQVPLAIFTDTSNNVGIGAAANASYKLQVTGTTNLTGALSGTSATFSGSGVDVFSSSGIGTSGVSGLFRVVTAGTSNGIAIGQSNSIRYTAIAANDYKIYNDDFFICTNGAFPLSIGTNNTARLTLNGTTGAATFSSSVQATKVILSGGSDQSELTNSVNNDFKLTNSGNFRIINNSNTVALLTITNAGAATFSSNVTIQTPSSGVSLLANGKANEWTIQATASSTSGQSFGLKVQGGTTTGDTAFLVQNQAGSTDYFKVRGGDAYTQAIGVYNNTSATANYVVVTSDGGLQRFVASSQKYKEEILDWNNNGLKTILALKPKTFKYKKDYYNKADIDFLGLIAEEVAEVCPYLADYSNEDRTGDVENVRYSTIVVPLIAAIQELEARIKQLENK